MQIGANVANWRRHIVWLVPFVLGSLAVSLVRFGFAGRLMVIPRVIAAGSAGYVGVISIKVFFAAGEIGGLGGGMATLGPLVLLFAIAMFLTRRAS